MIKLTRDRNNGFVYVNPSEIVSFADGHYGHWPTTVHLKDGRTIEVLERSKEINQMIEAENERIPNSPRESKDPT